MITAQLHIEYEHAGCGGFFAYSRLGAQPLMGFGVLPEDAKAEVIKQAQMFLSPPTVPNPEEIEITIPA